MLVLWALRCLVAVVGKKRWCCGVLLYYCSPGGESDAANATKPWRQKMLIIWLLLMPHQMRACFYVRVGHSNRAPSANSRRLAVKSARVRFPVSCLFLRCRAYSDGFSVRRKPGWIVWFIQTTYYIHIIIILLKSYHTYASF